MEATLRQTLSSKDFIHKGPESLIEQIDSYLDAKIGEKDTLQKLKEEASALKTDDFKDPSKYCMIAARLHNAVLPYIDAENREALCRFSHTTSIVLRAAKLLLASHEWQVFTQVQNQLLESFALTQICEASVKTLLSTNRYTDAEKYVKQFKDTKPTLHDHLICKIINYYSCHQNLPAANSLLSTIIDFDLQMKMCSQLSELEEGLPSSFVDIFALTKMCEASVKTLLSTNRYTDAEKYVKQFKDSKPRLHDHLICKIINYYSCHQKLPAANSLLSTIIDFDLQMKMCSQLSELEEGLPSSIVDINELRS